MHPPEPTGKQKDLMRRIKGWTIVATFLATLVGVVLFLNLSSGEKKIEQQIPRLYATDNPQFRRSLSALLGPQVLDGNKVEELLNGDQIFPVMLAEIRAARRTITLETYIYWSESMGEEFATALAERAAAGVKVHVLLDWIGSVKMDEAALSTMKAAGVEIVRYHEPQWWNLTRLNNRTHRKVLVVDGQTGFTGGVGIADQWRGSAQDKRQWRDSHFRAFGPVVAQMQAVFMDNWIKTTGRVLHGDDYCPAGRRRCSSPDVQQFTYRRQREHAPDGPAGHHCRAAQHSLVEFVLRSR